MTNNPTKEDILSSSAYKHLPAVRMEMAALAEKRDRLGAPFLKRKYRYLDGTYVLLHAMIGFNKIIMWGGGGYPHIVMTDYEGAWTYDWYDDKLTKKSFPADPDSDIYELGLKPIFNGRSSLWDILHLTSEDGKWSAGNVPVTGHNQRLNALPATNPYELGMYAGAYTEIIGRRGDKVGIIAELPKALDTKLVVPYGSLMTLPLIGGSGAVWNLFNGKQALTLNPANRVLLDSFYWTPSFFVAEPADDYNLKPGFYYGIYPNPTYDIDNTLDSLTVKLVGLIAKRYSGGNYQSGWVEFVSEVNGEIKRDLYIYDEPLTVPANPTSGYVRIAGTTADRTITTGWAGSGFEPAATLELDDGWENPSIDIWNHDIWQEEAGDLAPEEDKSGFTMVITQGWQDGDNNSTTKRCAVYRYTGYFVKLIDFTNTYHSHSVSHNGQYLAVFESYDGGQDKISTVHVWDLYGTREPTFEGEGTYTRAAATKIVPVSTPTEDTDDPEKEQLDALLALQGSDAVDVGAWTACVIPNREGVGTKDEFEPFELGYDLAQAPEGQDIEPYTDYLPSLGVIKFNRRGGGTPQFLKVTCTDGVTAKFGISNDECFSSTIIIEDPDEGGKLSNIKEEQLVGWWRGDGGSTPETTTIKGVVRGAFLGEHPNMTFQGIGTGQNITLSDTFSILEYEDGTFGFSGYSGEVSVGSCLVEESGELRVDPLCSECGQDYSVTASSSCGQNAEREYEVEPLPDIIVSGDEYYGVGSSYGASNGYGTVKFTASAGTITEGGLVTDISGTCGTVTVTATDECGRTGTFAAAANTGVWISTIFGLNGCGNPVGYDAGECWGYPRGVWLCETWGVCVVDDSAQVVDTPTFRASVWITPAWYTPTCVYENPCGELSTTRYGESNWECL